MNKYKIIRQIGDGTYGNVFEAINTETNERVAIKKLKNKINSWNECIEQNEVRVLRKLNNENLVKLMEVIREQNSDVSYIFEYCDCNLYDLIQKNRKQNIFLSEPKIRNIIYQVTCGINYLHSQGIMHRDLKPENVLINISKNSVKIADFGTAKEIPKYSNGCSTDYVCTRWYRAPECVLKSTNYNEKIDIWAIGCIMAELYNLKPFFPGIDEFDQINKICKILGTPEYNDWPEGYMMMQKLNLRFQNYDKENLKNVVYGASDDAINFLEKIFKYDPNKRPSAMELLNHPYFNNNVQRHSSYDLQRNFFNNNEDKYFNKYNANNDKRNVFENINIDYNNNEVMNNKSRYRNFSQDNYMKNNIKNYSRNNNQNRFNNNIYNISSESKNNNENEINKNNYNYYKNFNFSNYLNHNCALPDIGRIFHDNMENLKHNGDVYSKYNNPLTNSFNTQARSKFSSFARNDIMQNIRGDNKPFMLKNRFDDESYYNKENEEHKYYTGDLEANRILTNRNIYSSADKRKYENMHRFNYRSMFQ